MDLVKKKSKGKTIIVREPEEARQSTGTVVDLMEALRKSVTGKKPEAPPAKKRAGKRARFNLYRPRLVPERTDPFNRFAATQLKEKMMDWNRVEGNWKQTKGKVKEKWGKLTDDDLDVINGRRDQLEGKIQERYGIARDQVRKDVDDWYAAQR